MNDVIVWPIRLDKNLSLFNPFELYNYRTRFVNYTSLI